jgi:serine phosphatase RsbU (regulator of sigma subunit)/CHASE2 domain-containing sensor protein
VLAICQVWLGERYWEPVRHVVFDMYQQVLPRRIKRFPVVIVDIDETSIAALGQWPWPRTRLARLLDMTYQLGALSVGLAMIMPEADRLSPSVFIAERPDISPGLQRELAVLPTNDTILADTLRRTPSVVGRAGMPENTPTRIRVDEQTPVRIHGEMPLTAVPHYAGHVTNIPPIEAAASGRGYLNTEPDKDGVVRLVPLLVAVHGELAPTLGLELLRVAVGEPWYTVHADRHGVRGVQLGDTFIPTDPDGRRRLYFSKTYIARRLSAMDILHGKASAEAVRNTVALIGVTALGLADAVATPVTAHMDSVEVQAQTLENLLSGARLVRPALTSWLEVLAFVVLAIGLLALLPPLQPGPGVVLFLGGTTLICTGGFIAFTRWQVLFDPLFAIAGNILVLVVLLTAGFAASNRRRQELRAALEAERLARIRRDGELQAARDIQMGLLPAPWAITGLPENLAFHALLEPAKEVGGDLYDAFMLDTHRFFFMVGDVAGKGVPASLFMALSKTLCKSLALREQMPLAALITAVNQEIARDNPAALFVTAVAGILDVRTGDMELCSAGHEVPILLRQGAPPCSLTAASGPPLYILEDFSYPSNHIRLQSGDLLLLMTDGVTEAHNPQQMLYGFERVMAYCSAIQDAPEQRSIIAVCQGLYDDVKRFAHDAEPSDDIAIMAIRFTAPTAAA